MRENHPGKDSFLALWPGGYGENFAVYTGATGVTEGQIADACLAPFFNPNHVCMEIGCGVGFWLSRHLIPNFLKVYGIDLIPESHLRADVHGRFSYLEAGDCDYSCARMPDESVDFVWSFGCFCHLPNDATQEYLHSIHRVMKPGARASLYFSNTERRGSMDKTGVYSGDKRNPGWASNWWEKTAEMLSIAGFTEITDLMPESPDTMAGATKR